MDDARHVSILRPGGRARDRDARSSVAGQHAVAFNYVSDSNGTFWGIQDVAPPRVDTGSIRATQVGAGQNPAYSTTINGFGGIKVSGARRAPRFNGELMRGFGLQFNGADRFTTTQAVPLGGVEITRAVLDQEGARRSGRRATAAGWTRSRNTTSAPLTIKVAFGGQTGYSPSGANSSALVNTSSRRRDA